MEWRLEVRQAAFVQTDHHWDDLLALHSAFAEWLGRGRLIFAETRVWAYAASEEEARRFEAEAETVIKERDLFLVTSLQVRDGSGAAWKELETPEPPASDAEIEAELSPFIQDSEG